MFESTRASSGLSRNFSNRSAGEVRLRVAMKVMAASSSLGSTSPVTRSSERCASTSASQSRRSFQRTPACGAVGRCDASERVTSSMIVSPNAYSILTPGAVTIGFQRSISPWISLPKLSAPGSPALVPCLSRLSR